MDQAQLPDPVERVRSIIARHALPDIVRGYDIRTGAFDDLPAFWVTFQVIPNTDWSLAGMQQRGRTLTEMGHALDADFFAELQGLFPFYKFVETQPASDQI